MEETNSTFISFPVLIIHTKQQPNSRGYFNGCFLSAILMKKSIQITFPSVIFSFFSAEISNLLYDSDFFLFVRFYYRYFLFFPTKRIPHHLIFPIFDSQIKELFGVFFRWACLSSCSWSILLGHILISCSNKKRGYSFLGVASLVSLVQI